MGKVVLSLAAALLFLAAVSAFGSTAASNSAQGATGVIRPVPAATYIKGVAAGPLLRVENDALSPSAIAAGGVVTNSPHGAGLVGFGEGRGIAEDGVFGAAFGPAGIGVFGRSYFPEPAGGPTRPLNATTGVYGSSASGYGIFGATSVQHAPQPEAIAGVVGVDASQNGGQNDGVLGTTTNGGYGVEGVAGSGALGGVQGVSDSLVGVSGVSTAYPGEESVGGGDGVLGVSDRGLEGDGEDYGVLGFGTPDETLGPGSADTGVLGNGGTGVEGDATTGGEGVVGFTTTGVGVDGYASSGYGMVAQSELTPFAAEDGSGNVVLNIDANGNIHTAGKIEPLIATSRGSVVSAFTPRTTMDVLEDFGSASIANGSGVVRLDPAFSAAIETAVYQVFLTPNGESNGLYVLKKTPTEFIVRENHGGRASIAFDYRIVAKPVSGDGQRMALAHSLVGLGMAAPIRRRHNSPPRPMFAGRARAASNFLRKARSHFMVPRFTDFMMPQTPLFRSR
jgi:hypothetical protein